MDQLDSQPVTEVHCPRSSAQFTLMLGKNRLPGGVVQLGISVTRKVHVALNGSTLHIMHVSVYKYNPCSVLKVMLIYGLL